MHGPLLRAISETDSEEEVFLVKYNRLLGSVRLRQLRVRPDSCQMTPKMEEFVENCYGPYNEDTKDTAPFGPGGKYTYSDDGRAPVHHGLDFTAYDSGGYIVDLPYNPLIAAQVLQELEDDNWFNEGTRALLVTMNLYNPNMNMFSTCLFVSLFFISL